MVEFLKEHWVALLFGFLGFVEIITRLTPTKKDDTVLEWVKKVLDIFIPNRASGGGTLKK